MDIDRLRKKQAAGSRMKCFKCRQFGHMMKNCPVKNIRELQEDQIREILEEHFESPVQEEYDLSNPYTQKEEIRLENVPEEPEVDTQDTQDFH
jgi:hypothetical protein